MAEIQAPKFQADVTALRQAGASRPKGNTDQWYLRIFSLSLEDLAQDGVDDENMKNSRGHPCEPEASHSEGVLPL